MFKQEKAMGNKIIILIKLLKKLPEKRNGKKLTTIDKHMIFSDKLFFLKKLKR